MKIEIEIPDWADERHIYVFAGIELLAFKHVDEAWKIKTSRCTMCGNCCRNFKGVDCEHLKQDGTRWVCGLGLARPISCSFSAGSSRYEGCSEKFEVVNG